MFINTFSFSNSLAHFLSNCLALLFISVLGHFFLNIPAVLHVRHIIALFFMLQLTLVLSYIISLSFSSWNLDIMALFSWLVVYLSVPHSFALLFVVSSALFFIGSHLMRHLNCLTFLSRFIPALLFPDCITGRNTTVGTPSQKQQYQYLHTVDNDDIELKLLRYFPM